MISTILEMKFGTKEATALYPLLGDITDLDELDHINRQLFTANTPYEVKNLLQK